MQVFTNDSGAFLELDKDLFKRLRMNQPLEIRRPNINYNLMHVIRLKTDSWFQFALIIPLAYGAVHLSALSMEFPSKTERLLWKTSCYSLIAVAAGVLVYIFVSAMLWYVRFKVLVGSRSIC